MNNKFDQLAKALAQSTTRRQALKRFGVGLAGMVLACFGLANRTTAGGSGSAQPKYLCCTYFDIQGGPGGLCGSFCFPASQGCPAVYKSCALSFPGTPVDHCHGCGPQVG